MNEEIFDFIESQNNCENKADFEAQPDDELEDSPEDLEEYEEPENTVSYIDKEESERKFSHYELSYRARRIRELTKAPIKSKSHKGSRSKAIAA